MSDQCKKFKEDYNKLLLLKQEFDAALEEGAKSRNLEEAKGVKTELEKVLRKLEFDLKFKVWKTIELGTGLKTADDFIRALEKMGCGISGLAKFMLEEPEFTTLSKKAKYELVNITVADLGFSQWATVEEIYTRAKEMGLELCPPETGPQLCLQCKNHLMHKYSSIAMETIKFTNGGFFFVFRVARDDSDARLDANCGDLSSTWGADERWVFVRRKL